MLVEHGTDTVCAAVGGAILVNKEFFAIRWIYETITYPVHGFKAQDTECSMLRCYFVNDIWVGKRKIVVRVILFFNGNAQFLRVRIIEK